MSLPREPRQKMINMMYLVLTALLALNVSAEILNAFKTVNKSLETTNATVNNSTTAIMQSLEEKLNDGKTVEKARIWLPKAQAVQGYAKTVNSFIQSIKDEIIKQGGGDPNKSSFKSDNLDIATRLMVDKGKAKELYKLLSEFKTNVLKNIDPSIDSAFATTLPINLEIPVTQSKSNKTWERAYFHMVPTVAALTILSKFQNDVKTSENKVVEFCHNRVDKVVVRYDKYAAFAQSNSSYVMPGDEIEITAGVGAFSKAALPIITIAGTPVPINDDGAAVKTMTAATTLGEHTIQVNVQYTDIDGKVQNIPKTIKYIVGQSTASIALDKMNVLYVGVDNPVSIAASGGGADKMQVSISGGGNSIRSTGGGKYIARVNSVSDDCKITVVIDGKVAGTSVFRTRTIPKPVATVGGFESGAPISAAAFKAQNGVAAWIKDFPFELQYRVTSFVIAADNADGYIDEAQCQGNLWNDQARRIINGLATGRTVTIDPYATGPDGRSQKLPSLVYYIK